MTEWVRAVGGAGSRPSVEVLEAVARRYRRFAEHEARGVSPLYEALSTAVATDEGVLERLADLSSEKQQPNLLFAAFRQVVGTPASAAGFCPALLERWTEIEGVMLTRRVQTNEPARCAALLPVLARLPQPLALIEVGASAGLCLLPDRYAYDYAGTTIVGQDATAGVGPTFACEVDEVAPIPGAVPEIAWRRGIDLHPIDLSDAGEVEWLQALVWPEHEARARNLRAALEVASVDPPEVVRGDLRTDLAAQVAAAPQGATIVVFHSAVMSYLPSRSAIEEFAAQVRQLPVRWISNESPMVFPEHLADHGLTPRQGRFVLSLDARPLAFTGPHGQSIEWIG